MDKRSQLMKDESRKPISRASLCGRTQLLSEQKHSCCRKRYMAASTTIWQARCQLDHPCHPDIFVLTAMIVRVNYSVILRQAGWQLARFLQSAPHRISDMPSCALWLCANPDPCDDCTTANRPTDSGAAAAITLHRAG